MKIYVVCEDYTGAFEMITLHEEQALACADMVGGYVETYIMKDGELIEVDDDE